MDEISDDELWLVIEDYAVDWPTHHHVWSRAVVGWVLRRIRVIVTTGPVVVIEACDDVEGVWRDFEGCGYVTDEVGEVGGAGDPA